MMLRILVIFIFISSISYAQNNEALIDSVVTDFIKNRKIDDYFYTKDYCIGCFRINSVKDSSFCNSKGTNYVSYLFWKKKNYTLIKKFDNCGSYNSYKIEKTLVFDFFTKNYKKLQEEEILSYKIKKDSIVGNKVLIYSINSSHSSFKKFNFKNHNQSFKKGFDLFSLTNDSMEKNINYEHNSNLKIIELNKLCDELTDRLETSNKFYRLN